MFIEGRVEMESASEATPGEEPRRFWEATPAVETRGETLVDPGARPVRGTVWVSRPPGKLGHEGESELMLMAAGRE